MVESSQSEPIEGPDLEARLESRPDGVTLFIKYSYLMVAGLLLATLLVVAIVTYVVSKEPPLQSPCRQFIHAYDSARSVALAKTKAEMMATRTPSKLGSSDVIIRYGPEDFWTLTDQEQLESAVSSAERLAEGGNSIFASAAYTLSQAAIYTNLWFQSTPPTESELSAMTQNLASAYQICVQIPGV